MDSVEELDVFKSAHQMVLLVYEMTKTFPEEEKFGLSSQMRRAASSIPMNLAEGAGRLGRKEYRQFVGIARGSVGEIKYQLMLARDLGYIPQEIFMNTRSKFEAISRMLTGLAKSLASTRTPH